MGAVAVCAAAVFAGAAAAGAAEAFADRSEAAGHQASYSRGLGNRAGGCGLPAPRVVAPR